MGKAAAEVFACLQTGPAMVNVIAARTGRHLKTVKRALCNMSRVVDTVTGECLPMVEQADGGAWRALSVDLDLIAQVVGTSGLGERQTHKHKQERRTHSRTLLDGNGKGLN